MKSKPVVQRVRAGQDVDDAIAYYLAEGSPEAALGFVDAVERALAHIGHHPSTGSPRYGHELGISGPRAWPLTRYPYLAFYVELEGHIDVWRILHVRRDIPAWLQEPNARP